MQQFQPGDRPKILVFMTDGLPTVGETNAMRIVENARAAKVSGLRIFTFGVGYDVNTSLLDKLAAENGGVADYVEPQEDIEVKVSNFFAKISHPVLTDLRLDMAGVETDLLYPRALPDIFKGSQLTIIGRYKNAGSNGPRAARFEWKQPRFKSNLVLQQSEFSDHAKRTTTFCHVCGRRVASVG